MMLDVSRVKTVSRFMSSPDVPGTVTRGPPLLSRGSRKPCRQLGYHIPPERHAAAGDTVPHLPRSLLSPGLGAAKVSGSQLDTC